MELMFNKRRIVSKVICCLSIFFGGAMSLSAQQYEVGKNVHSHNDYLQDQPFYAAYRHHLASMEIDVFLKGKELYVAHDEKNINAARTIQSLYLKPLLKQIELNGNNKAYKDGGKLQLMIDLKTEGSTTLKQLEAILKPIRKYFDVNTNPDAVRLVITGATPAAMHFSLYDDIFFFDGLRNTPYTTNQLKRIAFFSANFKQFSQWKGMGTMLQEDSLKLKNFVDSVHQVGKPVRFWGNPDTEICWKTFMNFGVDYLNTDSPAAIATFLNKQFKHSYLLRNKREQTEKVLLLQTAVYNE